jgi:hypothetical protein
MKLIRNFVSAAFILTSPAFVHGDSQLRTFLSVNPTFSLETIVDFLHEHRYDSSLCNMVTLQLDVSKTPQTSDYDWRKINGIFITLLNRMEQAQNSGDMQWLDLLGYPIKELILNSAKERGIPGQLDGSLGNTLTLTLKIERTKLGNNVDWQNIMNIVNDYVDQLHTATKENQFEICLNRIGVPLKTVLETPNINKSLCITLKDRKGYSLYMRFDNKN